MVAAQTSPPQKMFIEDIWLRIMLFASAVVIGLAIAALFALGGDGKGLGWIFLTGILAALFLLIWKKWVSWILMGLLVVGLWIGWEVAKLLILLR